MDPLASLRSFPHAAASRRSAQPAPAAVESKREEEAVRRFAAVFVSFLVREMFDTTKLDGHGVFGNGPGAEVYRGFAVSAFGDALARSKALSPLEDRILAGLHPDREARPEPVRPEIEP